MSHQNLSSGVLQEFFHRFGVSPGGQNPDAECQKWQQLCDAMLKELNACRHQFDQSKQENAELRRALFHLLDKEVKPEDHDFSVEDVLAMTRNGQTFKELIEEQFSD